MKFETGDVYWLQAIGAINRDTRKALLKQKESKSKALNEEFYKNMVTIEKEINNDGLSIFDKSKTMKKELTK
jgi:hypothetical protein